MAHEKALSDKKATVRKPEPKTGPARREASGPEADKSSLIGLQQMVGNQAVQRMLAQRSGDGAFDLDEATAGRINQARGGGHSLDSTVQAQMSTAMGHDFSDVRVHTSAESDTLNQELNAKAFTTGRDIFFRQGEYDPGSSSGRELIGHELTHVVQQSTGRVGGSADGMTVNAPNDVYEQEADAIARQAASLDHDAGSQTGSGGGVQRQAEEEELAQTKAVQRQPEEEEMTQMKAVQRQEEEEEMAQTKAIQRQPEEEEMSL